jgi:hypothetical protein
MRIENESHDQELCQAENIKEEKGIPHALKLV